MAGEGGTGVIPVVGAIKSLIKHAKRIGKPTQQEVSTRVANLSQAEQERIGAQLGIPWWRVAGWSAAHYQLGVQKGFLPEVPGARAPTQAKLPAPERSPYLSPALYVSSAVRQAAITRAQRAGTIMRATAPGAPPGTGSGVGTPSSGYSPLTDPNLWLTLVDYILSWIRKPVAPVYNYFDLGGDPMAYFLPSVPTPSYGGDFGGVIGGLGSAVGSIISAIRGGAPSVMPGGAPFGFNYSGSSLALGNYNVATNLPAVRRPQFFGCDDGSGRTVIVRRAGVPLAWSGDVSAVKRLKRAHRSIAKALGGHRRGR